ncbi:MAG: FecR domain-containing protein [Bdellovibrionales bacterium]|nr:FecR domain-containing protein [Bdellovibrionales bacterium]
MTQTAPGMQSFQSKIPATVGILTLLGSLVLLWKFPDTFYPDLMDRDGDRIAEISENEKDVRLKPGGTLVWGQSRKGVPLFHKDSVATMVGARATIAFNDGSEIVMEPDSMIVIEEGPKPGFAFPGTSRRIQVKVHRGSFKRQKSGSGEFSVVPADGTEVSRSVELDPQPDSSVFRVSKRATGGVEVFSETGKVQVTRKEKDKTEEALVGEGERLKVVPGEVISKPSKRPALPAPKLKRPQIKIEMKKKGAFFKIWNFFFPEAHAGPRKTKAAEEFQVRFSWEKVEGASGYRVQISDKPRFTGSVESKDLKEPSFEKALSAKDQSKIFYLRVAGLDSEGNEGEFSDAERIDLAKVAQGGGGGSLIQVTQVPAPLGAPALPVAKPTEKPKPVATQTTKTAPALTETSRSDLARNESPATTASPSPRASLSAAPALSPTPSPVASVAPTTSVAAIASPSPSPSPTEEPKAVSGIQFRSELAAGANYAYRKFVGPSNPLRSIARGITPGIIAGEIYLSRMMRPAPRKVKSKSKTIAKGEHISARPDEEQDPDFSKEWAHLSFRAALQQASPKEDAVADQPAFVPVLMVRMMKRVGTWKIFGNPYYARLGFAGGLSSGIQWNDIVLKETQIPLVGVSLEIESDPDVLKTWNVMAHLTPWAAKSVGGEFGMTIRRAIPKPQPIYWRGYKGIYAQMDPQVRYVAKEFGWSIGIGVGYGL